jgi:hypothetical protein
MEGATENMRLRAARRVRSEFKKLGAKAKAAK